MRCEAFGCDRERLIQRIGQFEPCDLMRRILGGPGEWETPTEFARSIMSAKGEAARQRQPQQGVAHPAAAGEEEDEGSDQIGGEE